MLQLKPESWMCMHFDVFITRWIIIDILTLLLNNGMPRSIMILYLLWVRRLAGLEAHSEPPLNDEAWKLIQCRGHSRNVYD